MHVHVVLSKAENEMGSILNNINEIGQSEINEFLRDLEEKSLNQNLKKKKDNDY